MAAADHHADALHLGNDGAAELRQALIVVLAAATQRIVAVVGYEHPSHTEVKIPLHCRKLAIECGTALDVEEDPETTGLPGNLDVVHGLDEKIVLRPLENPAANGGKHCRRGLPGNGVKADIDRDGMGSRRAVPRILAAAAMMGAVVVALGFVLPVAQTSLARVLAAAALIGAGGVVFLGAGVALRAFDPREVLRMLRRRTRPAAPGS